jgi:hypothetical protein
MATERMIVWEGPSELTGEPIVVLATGVPTASTRKASKASNNVKTGDMIQIAILNRDVSPTDALKTGEDVNICGGCTHRSKASGGAGDCYTHKNLRRGFAQTSTWKAHRANGSAPFRLEAFAGRKVRFGSYGDPAAVPFAVWDAIRNVAEGVTGYTHQWKTCDPRFAELCMASADTVEERREARLKGYRAFRVRLATEGRLTGEVVCPASAEAGFKTVCATCLSCGGTGNGRKQDIVIVKH